MRVITGSARGRVLETLPGEDVRPTTDRVKEAMFSIIQFELEGRRVLDLFAGSGQLGIEALSRDAAYAVFVDHSADAVQCVRRNLIKTGLQKNTSVVQADALSFLRTTRESFDIAFLDPPYAKGILQQVLPQVAEKMHEGGVIVCEHPFGEAMPETAGAFGLYKQYKYGKMSLSVYRKKEDAA